MRKSRKKRPQEANCRYKMVKNLANPLYFKMSETCKKKKFSQKAKIGLIKRIADETMSRRRSNRRVLCAIRCSDGCDPKPQSCPALRLRPLVAGGRLRRN